MTNPGHFAHDLGVRLRQARIDRGLTQQNLAKRIGVTRTSLANLEAGRQRMSAHTLALAAIALELSPNDLLPPIKSDEGDHPLGQGIPMDLSDDHRQLVDRLLASAAHRGATNVPAEEKLSGEQSSRAS